MTMEMEESEAGSFLADIMPNREEAQQKTDQEHKVLCQERENICTKRENCEAAYDGLVSNYAQASCRALVQMMYNILPLEIRKLIYGYVYFEDAPIPVGSHHFTTYVPEELREQYGASGLHSRAFIAVSEDADVQDHSVKRDNVVLPDSWLLDPRWLGPLVALDVHKYYYEHNSFSICTIDASEWRFLTQDPLRDFIESQDVYPASKPGTTLEKMIPLNHIRHLQIRIKHEHFAAFEKFYEEHDPASELTGEQGLLMQIYDSLIGLTESVNPTVAAQLEIEFCIMTAYDLNAEGQSWDRLQSPTEHYNRHHTNLLEAIRIPIYMLRYDHGLRMKIIHYDEKLLAFPRDVTCVFQLTEEQWKEEKEDWNTRNLSSGVPNWLMASPKEFFIYPPDHHQASSGFPYEYAGKVLRGRWGLEKAFDTRCKFPITRCMIWPQRKTRAWERSQTSSVLIQDTEGHWERLSHDT